MAHLATLDWSHFIDVVSSACLPSDCGHHLDVASPWWLTPFDYSHYFDVVLPSSEPTLAASPPGPLWDYLVVVSQLATSLATHDCSHYLEVVPVAGLAAAHHGGYYLDKVQVACLAKYSCNHCLDVVPLWWHLIFNNSHYPDLVSLSNDLTLDVNPPLT